MERKDKMGKEQMGKGGGQQQRQGQSQGPGEKSGRFVMDCRTAGKGCSLVVMGSYDEVIEVGIQHARKAHGMSGEDSKLREDIKGYIKDASGWDMESGFEGEGEGERGGQSRGEYGDGGYQQGKGQGGMAGQSGSGTSPNLPA